jgi:predicted histidine transporter YuiF (NhaC family)
MATPTFPVRHLLTLAVAEGLVIASAVLRLALFPAQVQLDRHVHLAWLVGTILLASSGLSAFVVRSTALNRQEKDGADVTDDRKQVLSFSLAIIGLAALVSLIGPGAFERLLK